MTIRSLNYTLAARLVFPVEGEPIRDGRLSIEAGRIARVGRDDGRLVDLDLGNAAIVPGFINAHTHLELSKIAPLAPVENEIEWLRRVVDQRRGKTIDDLKDAASLHLNQAIRAGTTTLADTTAAGLSWEIVAEAPVRGIVFAEVIGLQDSRSERTDLDAQIWLSSIRPETKVAASCIPGLGPHAPYSTAGRLYHRAVASRLPLSTHLAEMPEERQLLETRDGPLRLFLEDLGAWDDAWEPIGPSPADYVRKGALRKADWLIAHGNYLNPSEFWQLRPEAAPEGKRVAVAYCPRTHARFGHAPHPFKEMLARGIVVCLGTDSLASSPSLSILDEIRFLHRLDPELDGRLLLTMATLFGAWALKAETVTGSLKVGKSADLAVVPLPERDADDPHSLLLDSDLAVSAAVFEGRFVHGPWTDF